MSKQINARFQQKHDIEANWIVAGNNNFVPKSGEIIVYDPDVFCDYSRIKIGDGESNINDLKFVDAAVQEQIAQIDFKKADVIQTKAGSIITVDDSAHTPLKGLNVYGRTTQKTTTGAQLLDYSKLKGKTNSGIVFTVGENELSIKGTATQANVTQIFNFTSITLTPGTYTLSVDTPVSMDIRFNSTKYLSLKKGKTSVTSEITEDYTINHIAGTFSSGSEHDCTFRLMLNKGEEALPYESYTGGTSSPSPDYPQELESVGADGSVEIHINDQTLTVMTPNGLPGIPVASDGNYIENTNSETYLEIEYLESNGTQYIDTGIIASDSIITEVKCQSFVNNKCIVGMGTTASQRYQIYAGSNGYYYNRFDGVENTLGNVPITEVATIKLDPIARKTSINGTEFELNWTGSVQSRSLWLFGRNQTSSPNNYLSTTKMWYCKMWDGKTLVRDFVPCRRYSDGKLGMYDRVTKTFFVNATESEFIAGNFTGKSYAIQNNTAQQWICDEIDFARGIYIQRIGKSKVVPTGISGTVAYAKNLVYHQKLEKVSMLCDHFIKRDLYCESASEANTQLTDGQMSHFLQSGNSNTNLYFKHNAFTSLDAALAWFEEHPTIVYYPLESPVETALTEEQLEAYAKMHGLYPATVITNNANAHLKVKYYTPTTAVQMVHSPYDKGKILTIDEHGCVILGEVESIVKEALAKENEILPETELVEDFDGWYVTSFIKGVRVGGTYIVKYNGTPYECVGIDYNQNGMVGVGLGNTSFVGGADNGTPFAMLVCSKENFDSTGIGAVIMRISGDAPRTVGIYRKESNGINIVNTATVGQIMRVKSVDDNGVPTEWEAVDFPSDDHINSLINTALEAIKNNTY